MNPDQLLKQNDTKLKATIERFESEIKKLRTGRAHPSMLDGVVAEAYGTPMPLIQLATVSAPEPQLIQISPFDPSTVNAISNAIRDNHALGMNPSDDGRIIRVPIPALNEERRRDIVKQLGEKVEECLIAMRAVRRDTISEFDAAKKDKDISDDDHKRYVTQVDAQMTKHKGEVDAIAKAKETEIMTV